MQKLVMEHDCMVHCGKRYEDMSKHHQRQKLADFRRVIWPDSRVTTGSYRDGSWQVVLERLSVPLCDDVYGTPTTCSRDTPGQREVDEATALQTLYLLDRFGVSDEYCHG